MKNRRRKFYGWGYQDQSATAEEVRALDTNWSAVFGVESFAVTPPPALGDIAIGEPRIRPCAALAHLCRDDRYERALHAFGRSFLDSARMFNGDFTEAPDIVAYPESEEDVAALIAWCGDIGAAVIPFGGGSSVVGGVNPRISGTYRGVVTIDLLKLDKVCEVDRVSRSARVQGGVYGPRLEAQLKEHGLTLRHYPQSFEMSTLGGWIATRAAGHFATLGTQIDDWVESIRLVAPAGTTQSLRVPLSGAGPSPDRFLLGSEGALGIITEAWIRVLDKPVHRAGATAVFPNLAAGAEAVREIVQSGLRPDNCRLIDAREAALTGAFDGGQPILVLGFESPRFPVTELLATTLGICADHGGAPLPEPERGAGDAVTGKWRNAFIRAPYYREHMTARGICRETFETSVPWSNFANLHATVTERVDQAIKRVTGRDGTVTMRFTHVYPNGPAPYFTFHCLPHRDHAEAQCFEIKRAAYDAVEVAGGTITHHHAVGRLHMPWYTRQRPALFGEALEAAKRCYDPQGLMNPGVIVREDVASEAAAA